MLDNQEYITIELREMLYNILSISSKKLKNLVYIVVGILLSKSVVLSEISEKLKDDYTGASEASKTVSLWYKIFKYKEKGNKNFKHIKQGIKELNNIFASYNYEIILLADRGFKSIDELGWKFCIRCTNDMIIKIEGNEKVKYLRDIKPLKKSVNELFIPL